MNVRFLACQTRKAICNVSYHACGHKSKRLFSQSDPQGGYSGFQVMGMIEWSQKSRPKKILRASSKTQKNPWTKN